MGWSIFTHKAEEGGMIFGNLNTICSSAYMASSDTAAKESLWN